MTNRNFPEPHQSREHTKTLTTQTGIETEKTKPTWPFGFVNQLKQYEKCAVQLVSFPPVFPLPSYRLAQTRANAWLTAASSQLRKSSWRARLHVNGRGGWINTSSGFFFHFQIQRRSEAASTTIHLIPNKKPPLKTFTNVRRCLRVGSAVTLLMRPDGLRNGHMATQCARYYSRLIIGAWLVAFTPSVPCPLILWCNASSWWHREPFDYRKASVGAPASFGAGVRPEISKIAAEYTRNHIVSVQNRKYVLV